MDRASTRLGGADRRSGGPAARPGRPRVEPGAGRRRRRGASPAIAGGRPRPATTHRPTSEPRRDGRRTRDVRCRAQRRKAAATIVGLWRELTRDLVVARLGVDREVRDPGLLDDLRDAAATLGALAPTTTIAGGPGADQVAGALTGFLIRLDAAGELLEANVRPELVIDTLLLAWPSAAAAGPAR
jgi:hypothetical protein